MANVKDEAKKLIDSLPETAGWDEIIQAIYIRFKIDAGLKAAEDGKVISHEQVRKFLITK